MRHFPALVLPALAVVALLAGCTSAPPVDEQALSAWESKQEARTETDDAVLGVLSARIAPGDGGDDPEDQPGIRVQFPDSRTIDHLEFSCYGKGQMRGVVRTVSARGSQRIELDPMSCADSPHQIELSSSTAVDSVAFGGFDSDRSSAWRLVVIGPGPSVE